MKILSNLVIATLPSKYEPDKPYVLWIEGHGRVGDKFDVAVGKQGHSFPAEASDRFSTRSEATAAYHKFKAYVKDVIDKPKKTPKKDDKNEKKHRNPSYYSWE